MNLQLLQKFLPTGIAFIELLGVPQREWLTANADKLPSFLHSKEGKEALLLLLGEFHTYVNTPEPVLQSNAR
jgi:hypothetical protein